jgi:anti-sigma B factor antagonist
MITPGAGGLRLTARLEERTLAADLRAPWHYQAGRAEVVEPAGTLDQCAAPSLRRLLADLADRAGCLLLVVDLRRVTFLGAAGLGALIGGWQGARSHGVSFALACTDQRLLRVLHITGLAAVMAVRASVDEALESMPATSARTAEQPAP